MPRFSNQTAALSTPTDDTPGEIDPGEAARLAGELAGVVSLAQGAIEILQAVPVCAAAHPEAA